MDFHHVLGFANILKLLLAELKKLKHDISAYIVDMYLQGNTKIKCVMLLPP